MSIDRDEVDDAPERDDAPPDDGGEDLDQPQPATWAGKQGWSGLPDEEPEAEADEEPAAQADEEPAAEADEEEVEDQELTREADTLAVGDQEEAREAALAGLQARTAEHAAKRGVTDPGPGAEQEVVDEEEEEEAGEAAEADATVVAASTGADEPPPADEAPADELQPPRHWLWARFLTASFLIIVSMATATSISLLVYLTDIAKGLGGLEGLSGQLDALDEEAQNFLILGSDVRPGEGSRGRSDTTMLLRVDPDKGLISQLSIPRDLKVNIPGHGIDKFNVAYTYGGPKLALQVVKQLTGQQVDVNHVVNVDFNGFADAVDAIDCVYVDVDRHYLNSNVGVATTEQYAE
ncbi:MAG: LCP family protein, partial [bacterium]